MNAFFAAAFLLLGLIPAVQATETPLTRGSELRFGIVPQQAPGELAQRWTPFMVYLSRVLNYPVRFETAKDIPTFERRLAAGAYDVAYINPYHYTVFSRAPGYRVFAAENKRLTGILVVAKDSPLKTRADLHGLALAFPGPAAFAATVLPLAALERDGIAVTPHFVSSHDSVYLAVDKGLYPAGGGVMRTFKALPADLRARLRILATTPAYTPHAIAAHPRVSPAMMQALQDALIGLAQAPEGASVLAGVGFNGIVATEDADYDPIRKLDIKILDPLVERR